MGLLTRNHYEYLTDPIFLQRYISILNSRLVYNNNRIELNNEEMDQLYDHANILSLDDNLKAFNLILSKLNEKGDKKITQDLIKTIANTINEHAIYISNNYRTVDNTKLKDKYPIEKTSNIEQKMTELLDNYYHKWNNLDIFEREALFNIEFLRIHPFDDGNGRTSRLILNYNLFLNGHAPVLIPPDKREEYFDARNRQDVNWIKNIFKEESTKELEALDKLIESYEQEKNQPKQKR